MNIFGSTYSGPLHIPRGTPGTFSIYSREYMTADQLYVPVGNCSVSTSHLLRGAWNKSSIAKARRTSNATKGACAWPRNCEGACD